jgi:hypothetical protein
MESFCVCTYICVRVRGDLMLFSLISRFNCGDQFYVEEGTRIPGEKPAGLSEVLDRMLY